MSVLLSLLLVGYCSAFSTPEPTQRQFIEITNPLTAIEDRLPASFVSSWPTWVLDPETKATNKKYGEWSKIPDDNGFVNPSSIDELWQAQDLKPPTCQLAVGLHVRDGMIRHILPAVDVSFEAGKHRNRGLCSVPRAYQWMDFNAAMAGGLDVMSLVLQVNNNNNDEEEWETIAEIESIETCIQLAITALAEQPPEDLGDGSSVVHVLLDKEVLQGLEGEVSTDVPTQAGAELRVLLQDDGYTMGCLHVSIQKTEPGSESEYLPEAYKPLFLDESLRRPAFVEARKRLADSKNNNDT